MKRVPWDILLALLAGLGIGLVYAWMISPLRVIDSEPAALRADFKDQFRSAIAASYAATGNLPRAQARLSLLDDNPVEALNAQAQRTIASGQFAQADQLAALAFALENGTNLPATPTAFATDIAPPADQEPTVTSLPPPEDDSFITETPLTVETAPVEPQPIQNTATPRPTRTPPPTQGASFALTAQDTVCDPNLPDGLLQVMVYSSNRRQLAGIKVIIIWETGEEQFFTGLKPELGNGYADYLMTPDTAYTIQLGPGSDIATNLIAPTCQMPNGETYLGGFKLTFQQP
ncbi:MAG: hypothetical protein C3F07_12175 [Anaerolineales bacterium]|nr:hypothetical protein [Anaerolineae bacterium]PWB72324.1 MAG: hypothetical protein C3F07_12175 [Anaerolineales bacterium]